MSIEAIQFGLEAIKPITPQQPKVNAQGTGSGESFGDMLSQMIGEVNTLQVDADNQIENVLTDKPGSNIHEAMVALEKADVAFQFMTNLQQKILSAYQEVARTQL